MTKEYKVVTPNGEVSEFTARNYIDAKYAVLRYVDVYGYDGCTLHGVHTFLKGIEVSVQEFIEACDTGYTAWYEKKLITHKKVRVLHGSSVGCYVNVWVKR